MSTSAIIMMTVALVIIWGGLIYAIKALPKEKTSRKKDRTFN